MPKLKPRKITLNYLEHSQKAADFHNAWRTPTRMLVGAQGSGKSVAMVHEVLRHLMFNPAYQGKRALVCGLNGAVLRDQLLPEFKAQLTNYDSKGRNIGAIEGTDYEIALAPTLKITFWNRSEIIFLSLEAPNALKAWTVSIVMADDIGRSSLQVWNDLCDRARAPQTNGAVNMMLATANPEAPSSWLYQNYFKSVVENGVQPEHCYLDKWTMYDNLVLKERWPVAEARYAHSAVEFRRRILGEFCAQDGLVFTNFDRTKHLKKLPPGVLQDVKVMGSMDFGTGQGCGLLYVAEYESKYYVFKEYFTQNPTATTATHSQWIKRQSEVPAKIYTDHAPELVNNLKELGHFNLAMAPKGRGSIEQGIDTVQRLFFEDRLLVSPDCKQFIKELESYERDARGNPVDRNICLADCIRYVMTPLAGKRINAFVAATRPLDAIAPVMETVKAPVPLGEVIGMRRDGTMVYASSELKSA